MAEYPALPLFTDAYMADTRHLTTTQHGAYLLLLMTAWRMPDCKLPDDDNLLARWAGLDYRNWRKMRPLIIDQFWKKDGHGKLQQNRLLDERKYADSRRRKNAEAGKASALKRKERHSTTVATKPQPDSNPHTHTLPIREDKDKSLPSLKRWQDFKILYPKGRAGNWQKNESAYRSAIKRGFSEDEIYQGLLAYANSDEVARGFVKGAAAWLNDDRFKNTYQPKGLINATYQRNSNQSSQGYRRSPEIRKNVEVI